MRHGALFVWLVAVAGCVRGQGPRAAAETDECFEKRDHVRRIASTGDPRIARSLAQLEARCSERATVLTQGAETLLRAHDVERARLLLDRALALAARDSHEFARADELRRQLDRASAPAERDYRSEAREAEAASDWAAAREAYRAALDAGKEFPGLRERLTFVEQKCIEGARRALAEGRSFEAAQDLAGALGALDSVFELIDDPAAAEYVEAERAQERVQEALDRQEDDGIDEPPAEGAARSAEAEDAEHRLDWVAARNAYRALAEENPDDTKPREDLARAQEECLVVARREIVTAKAYESALNYVEAAKSLASALRCADAPHLPEHAEARRLLDGLRSQNLPAPSLLSLPSGRDELLRFGDDRSLARDWLTAREAFRRAAEAAPGDADVTARVDSVEAECLRSARRFLSEAKAYEAAENYPEALKAARQALLYADAPETKENQLARELERRIHVEMTYP